MKLRLASLLLLAICVIAALPTMAAVVYTNGPINGNLAGQNISGPYAVSDSFTVSSATSITGFDFGSWVAGGDTPTQVDWAIGTSFFGTDVASGTASLSNVLFCSASPSCGNNFYDVYTSTVSGLNVAVGVGTYYLTLQNGATSLSGALYWDENDGPSSAMQTTTGSIGSESFTINGGITGVPEPGSLIIFGTGLVGLAGAMRRKLNF